MYRYNYRGGRRRGGRFLPFFVIFMVIALFSGHHFLPFVFGILMLLFVLAMLRGLFALIFGASMFGAFTNMFRSQQRYYQPPYQQNPNQQSQQQYYQPPYYQPYQQGYQPAEEPKTYQEGEQQYQYPPQTSEYDQYEQPKAQYPQEMPPMQ